MLRMNSLPVMKIFVAVVGIVLLTAGASLILFSLFADSLGYGGMPGLGPRQVVMLWVGCIIAGTGIFLVVNTGNQFIFEWFSPLDDRFDTSLTSIAVWFGTLTGLAEVIIIGYRKAVHAQYLGMSLHLAWMIPLAEIVLFLFIGVLIYTASRIWKSNILLPVSALAFTFLSVTSILLLFPLHIVATLFLAAGLAFQTARLAAGYPQRFQWLVSRTLPWFAAVYAGLLIVMVLLNP